MAGIVMPVVKAKSGVAIACSVDVATSFNRRHKSILVSTRSLIEKVPRLEADFCESTYEVRGKKFPCFEMTKNGFFMLGLGLTGEDARNVAWGYLEEFDRVQERSINEPTFWPVTKNTILLLQKVEP